MMEWYVAKAKPRSEAVLMSCLARRDVEVFYPTIRRPGHGSESREALFPTYIFCRVDPASPEWAAVRWATGLSYFLNTDGHPTAVSNELVEHVRDRVQRWNDGATRHPLAKGDRIKVLAGPFGGIEGLFQRYIHSQERCQVLLETISGMLAVELPGVNISPRTSAPIMAM